MNPIRIALVSETLEPSGGGAKDIALLFKSFDRTAFQPHVVTPRNVDPWMELYGIQKESVSRADLKDADAVAKALQGTDVVLVLVGTGHQKEEYEAVMAGADRVGVKVKILRIVFGLGAPNPKDADLFLTSSMDSFLTGTPCRGCHVVYPSLPSKDQVLHARLMWRQVYGIKENDFVIGYACADHRREFYDTAWVWKRNHPEFGTFLSALGPHHEFENVPDNVRYCGILKQYQMGGLYETSDVIVHTRTESFGYAPYQAMAHGVPVVALWTNSKNAFSEAMYPDGGYLARDVNGLYDALEHVRKHPEEAKERARIAKTRVQLLEPPASSRRIQTLIYETLRLKGFSNLPPEPPPSNKYITDVDLQWWAEKRREIVAALGLRSFI